ncbi:MAG: hypothetical protein J6X89_04320 [Bacteroidales bacterium]|nr:hypothetical protein [Bacteroidales bacterium]
MKAETIRSFLQQTSLPIDRRLVRHLVGSLTGEELSELMEEIFYNPGIPEEIVRYLIWYSTHKPVAKQIHTNEPVGTLLAWYSDKKSGKVSYAKKELKRRFEGQSFPVQKQILMAFLGGGKTDIVWAGKYLRDNWIPSFGDIVLERWRQTRIPVLANSVLQHMSDDIVLQEQDSLSEDCGYAFLCARIGNNTAFKIDQERLTDLDWFYVMAKLGRQDAVPEIDGHLDGFILSLEPAFYRYMTFSVFLSSRQTGIVLWAMERLHYTAGIVRFYDICEKAMARAALVEDEDDKIPAMITEMKRQIEPEAYTLDKCDDNIVLNPNYDRGGI